MSAVENYSFLEYAKNLDLEDELPTLKEEFLFPKEAPIYLCGNSLGLQPRELRKSVLFQLDKWAHEGVEGHFSGSNLVSLSHFSEKIITYRIFSLVNIEGDTPWLDIDSLVTHSLSKIVGAKADEVVLMNSLSANLHFMISSFYRPSATRFKILMEKKSFPSDYHVVMSQLQLHSYDIDGLIELEPRKNEVTLQTEDIIDVIFNQGDSIAVILLSGVQYYTGQFFDMEAICIAAKSKGCFIGFDLAHAIGNVPLSLHDWGCDFACWCTYKYLNCGPGAIGGCFVHEKHGKGGIPITSPSSKLLIEKSTCDSNEKSDEDVPRLRMAGWWGHRREDRFLMDPTFIPCSGANGFRVSNPPVLLIACAKASLDIFDKIGIHALRQKSIRLTGYLEKLIQSELSGMVNIFTPSDPAQRGCQLSLSINLSNCKLVGDSEEVEGILVSRLKKDGIVCDFRKPNVLRVAPTPLYNTFEDVYLFVSALKKILYSSLK